MIEVVESRFTGATSSNDRGRLVYSMRPVIFNGFTPFQCSGTGSFLNVSDLYVSSRGENYTHPSKELGLQRSADAANAMECWCISFRSHAARRYVRRVPG